MTRREWCENDGKPQRIHYHRYCQIWPDDLVDEETGAFLVNYEDLEIPQADGAADEGSSVEED